MLRKTRNEITEEDKINDPCSEPLFDKLPDHVSCMWELPQIYEFLCFAKGTLHISNISMYEMERMLSMPKASKQLANIMTSLLSVSVPRSRLLKIPPMPYEFWTNVLLNHKLRNWLKVYENKERDSIKVLEALGIEPEFWRIFPNPMDTSQHNFDEFNLRQRVWLLKTVCDTMMHGKKSLQDELANRYMDGEGEKILGRDRHGARYFYFPIFLDTDIRVYKHNLNNKILLNVTPIAPKLKIHSRRIYSRRDRRRKKSRWKNGNLPQKQKKSRVNIMKINNDNTKINIKNELTDEKSCNNDNTNLEINIIENKEVKEEENEDNENKEHADDKEIMNSSLLLKSLDGEKNDGQPHPDNVSNSSKTDDEKINEIKTTTGSSDNIVSSPKIKIGVISKSDDEKLIETKSIVDNNDEDDKIINNNDCLSDKVGLNIWMKALLDNKHSKDKNNKECDDDDDDSDDSFVQLNFIRTRSQTLCKKEMTNFNNILMDLSVSKFQLVADSVESLRELVSSLTAQNSVISNEPVRCEMLLIKKLKALIASIKQKETLLKESTEIAREKLKREWKNFQDGIKEEDVEESSRYTSEWVLGSQGCPLLSCGETMSHAADDIGHDKAENERNDYDEEENETEEKTETRRVLRARGVSSYMEQFSSDDDTDSSHPEGWAEIVDPATGIHLGMSAVQIDGVAEDDDETEGTGSDQDWILPGKRKRKSKRISSSRRLKLFQNKLQNIEGDIKNTESTSSLDIKNKPRQIYPKNTLNSIKIESVHSEFHIKDEGPTVDPLMTNTNPVITTNNNVQPNYVIHQMVNTPNGPMNYVVMPSDNSPHPQASGVVSMIPQVPIQQGYYIQNPQGCIVSNPQIAQVRSQYINQESVQAVHGVIIQQSHQPYINPANNYIQYQQLGAVPHPVSLYPSPLQQPAIINPSVKFTTHSSKISPRVIQNRQIVPPYRPRHPVGAVIRSTVPFRGNIRMPNSRRGRGIKVIAPRNPGPQRNVQTTNVTNNTSQNSTKTTSLIVLSDSDDEIEMIIPQKNDKTEKKPVKNTNSSTLNRNTVDNNRTAVASTAGDDQQSSSPAVLTPQIIQRMSQGGISITPIKPKETTVKSSPISATQLVVVVNESGSHYALALPNGSKLILTPEQVAQIRASNGGKLVL